MSESEQPAKKQKLDSVEKPLYVKGVAPIKAEYLLPKVTVSYSYNDEEEGGGVKERSQENGGGNKKGKKQRGQNKNRKFEASRELVKLCQYSAEECPYKERCKFEHDLNKYLESKPADIEGICPVYAALGHCPVGIKCRWLHSHFANNAVTKNEELMAEVAKINYEINKFDGQTLNNLQKRKFDLPLSDKYIPYMEEVIKINSEINNRVGSVKKDTQLTKESEESAQETVKENAAAYIEAPFKPSEKKKLHLKGAKIVSPLTTVGNLPYRRLMRTLGADYTYGEMALCLPIVQGSKSEWALTRAHSSEIDRFGVQLATATPWQAVKAAEAVSSLTTGVSEINLNSGCPIDLVFRTGAGSALMDNPARMLRLLNGMSAVSGEIPVTVKIRTGVKDDKPTAQTLVPRLLKETSVAAITIHGRSRAQRYTKTANWEYIGEISSIVREQREELADKYGGRYVKPWIIGNGDVFSWEDWYSGLENQQVDSLMVARGALIKPWIFEEIEARQHLDKSATERLEILRTYANFGLEHWGSDEYGVSLTRKFLCEFLSFTHRYIPTGILEYLPPKINDRPNAWKGRNELETLLGSNDAQDWIKITEMFLGPATENFGFVPKHKSNSYETPKPQ